MRNGLRSTLDHRHSSKIPLVYNTQNNLATRVPFCSLFVCLACLGKGQYRVDDGLNPSCIDQRANLDQLLPVGFNNKPGRADVIHLRLLKGWAWADNSDQRPSLFHYLPGAPQGIAAYCIEDDIDTVHHLLEARGGVVDGLVSAKFAQEVAIAGRGGGDDLRTSPASQLD